MTTDIKVGDKVRVREDAPKLYDLYTYPIWRYESKVENLEGEIAVIKPSKSEIPGARCIIPFKYLIKVEDEAKEAKFKVGDRVRVCSKDAERYGRVGTVVALCEKERVYVDFGDIHGCRFYAERYLDHYRPYIEPTEEKNKVRAEDTGFVREAIDATNSLFDNGMIDTSLLHLYDTDWDAYAADLAKEIALKVANKYSDPEEAAEYAVKVAKAVIEELKKK